MFCLDDLKFALYCVISVGIKLEEFILSITHPVHKINQEKQHSTTLWVWTIYPTSCRVALLYRITNCSINHKLSSFKKIHSLLTHTRKLSILDITLRTFYSYHLLLKNITNFFTCFIILNYTCIITTVSGVSKTFTQRVAQALQLV